MGKIKKKNEKHQIEVMVLSKVDPMGAAFPDGIKH